MDNLEKLRVSKPFGEYVSSRLQGHVLINPKMFDLAETVGALGEGDTHIYIYVCIYMYTPSIYFYRHSYIVS